MVHEPGTGGLQESTDSDSEEEEDEDDDDDEEATQDSLLQQDEESEMDSEDDFEEGADGGSSAKVSKKSKKMDAKSSLSTVSTISRKRGDWQLVAQFNNTGSSKKAMRKVKKCFEEQMCLDGAGEMKTSYYFKTLGGWKHNKVFISNCFMIYFFQHAGVGATDVIWVSMCCGSPMLVSTPQSMFIIVQTDMDIAVTNSSNLSPT